MFEKGELTDFPSLPVLFGSPVFATAAGWTNLSKLLQAPILKTVLESEEKYYHTLRMRYSHCYANQFIMHPHVIYFSSRSWLKLSDDLDGAISSMTVSPSAGALLIDQPVLARRTDDGLYYKGRVKSQVNRIYVV